MRIIHCIISRISPKCRSLFHYIYIRVCVCVCVCVNLCLSVYECHKTQNILPQHGCFGDDECSRPVTYKHIYIHIHTHIYICMFGVIRLSERSYEVIIPRLDRILEVSCDAYTPHTHAQTYTHMLTVAARGKKPTQTL